jgi:RNA polymerase sigma-70 factor (ECF subfamily)
MLVASKTPQSVFEDVVLRHGHALHTIARGFTRDPQEAYDLLQDTLERALRASPDLQADELRRWIVAVMRHLFIDGCRKRRVSLRALHLLQSTQQTTPSDAENVDSPWSELTCDDLAEAVAKLDLPFRQVVELHTKRKPLSQMAAELGIPATTVGTRLFRAKRKLRATLMRREL